MKQNYLLLLMVLAFFNSQAQIVFQNRSVTPNLLYTNKTNYVQGISAYTLIGSDDALTKAPGYVFGGAADGSGILKSGNKFVIVVNNEDNFSVSRVWLDANFVPDSADYIMNSDAGGYRMCSATLATQAEHGFGPKFLTCGETFGNIYAVDPLGAKVTTAGQNVATGLGKWGSENAVPLNKNAYNGKTVILIGDDDSGTNGGQLIMYVSNTVGDLINGTLYAMRRTNSDKAEKNMTVGNVYDVEFIQVADGTTVGAMTSTQLDAAASTANALVFGRVEDIDYRKGSAANSREIYFNATGQANTGVNSSFTRTKWGRTYRLKLDATNPLIGKLEVILDGDIKTNNPTPLASEFMNPDNVCATQDYVYIQEDPNRYSAGNPANADYIYENHDARIYQYEIATGNLKILCELNHLRSISKYNQKYTGTALTGPTDANASSAANFSYAASINGDWEYGAMVDISEITGTPNSFLLSLQPHTWAGPSYFRPDVTGAAAGTTGENFQASMLMVLTGVQRVNTTTAIMEKEELTNNFVLYPNPSNGKFNVKFPENMIGSTIEVINTSGLVVYTGTTNQNDASIDLSGLTAGTYIVNASIDDKKVSKKISIK